MAGKGHNSGMADLADSGIAGAELRQFIERIERLQEERKAIADDVRDIYAEAKGRGFDTRAIKELVRLRAKEPHEREEFEAIVELYASAIGMDYAPVTVSRAPAPAPAPAPVQAPAREDDDEPLFGA